MQKILMTTFGSYGDLHPYLAMARVLIANGYEVTIATHVEYQEYVERLGARYVRVKPGLEEVGPKEVWAAEANHPLRGTSFIIRNIILPYLDDSYHAVREAAASQDLIISHVLSFATPIVAEELRIPWISAVLQPGTFFSAYDPPTFGYLSVLPKLRFLGPKFMRWFMNLLAYPTRQWLTPLVNLRSRIGLPPNSKNILIESCSPLGSLVLFPPAFAPAQPDWPANCLQIGFPLFDEETTSDLSPELEAFLNAGPPPVVFTLGTAIAMMATPYFEVAYQVVKQLGVRAAFLAGKDLLRIPQAATTDPSIHISIYEPFSKIFPRSAAIVHQCGIGTTSQALASGRPQVLVPFAHDQPDNARRVVALGAGVSIDARRLNVPRLATALNSVLHSESIANRARQIVPDLRASEFDQKLLNAVAGFLKLNI